MDLYRKVGKRYKKAGIDFQGFPANGVWVVKDGSQSLISKVGELSDPMPLANMAQHSDFACKKLREYCEDVRTKTSCKRMINGKMVECYTSPSYHDMVREVIIAIARAEEETNA